MIARLLLLVLVTVTAACGGDRPNVLIIVMDTTRGDRCGLNGYERPTTPHLDRFAADAVTFRNAWVPGGWTGPTHASLFTGLRPEHHGFVEGNRPFLVEEAVTLAERFSAAGYATAAFSNNWVVAPEWGLTQGFATYEPLFKKLERRGSGAVPARRTRRIATRWAEEAAQRGRPFFLFINNMEPHLPYEPKREVSAPFLRDGPSDEELARGMEFNHPSGVGFIVGRVAVDERQMRLLNDLYDAEIAALDAEIGGLLEGLASKGLLANTIVVVTSDHGENIGDHGLMDHKFSLHRTITHVPLVVRLPGHFEGGRLVDETVRLEDIAPTLYELCGVEAPAGLDGDSLTGDLGGRVVRSTWGAWLRHEQDFQSNFPGADPAPLHTRIRAVFDGRWHLMLYSDGRRELYDVVADPEETVDLASESPAEVERLTRLLDDD